MSEGEKKPCCHFRHFDSDSAFTPSLGRRHRLARELARDNAFCAIAKVPFLVGVCVRFVAFF